MAAPKPLSVPVLTPDDLKAIGTGTKKQAAKLSYKQLRSLWIQAGGDPNLASTMAAVALAESGGRPDALNDNASTGDYSVGPWQINYFGDMREGRTRAYGTPEKLRSDPLANARAAVAIYNGQGLNAWTTYTSGAYSAFLTPQTPAEKAAQSAADAAAKATSTPYLTATEQLAQAKIAGQIQVAQAKDQAKALAHYGDNAWVTVQRDKAGHVIGFGEDTGPVAPANALRQGTMPLTQATLNQLWTNNYDTVFQQYTGRIATPSDIAGIIEKGYTPYALKSKLAGFNPKTGKFKWKPEFANSPVYKANVQTVRAQAAETLGKPPPASFVAQAIVYGWTGEDVAANVKTLPGYKESPGHAKEVAGIRTVYKSIYGTPDVDGDAWITQTAADGWTQEQAADALRSHPSYKYSVEAETNTLDLLDTLGMLVGKRSVLKPAPVPTNVPKGQPQPALPFKPMLAAK